MSEASASNCRIRLNGDDHLIKGDRRLTTLIAQLQLRKGRVAVEINLMVIPKAQWDRVELRPGDTVEIVNFVGGG